MENVGHIEIIVSGAKGNIPLSPDNYDIRDIMTILENAENLLFPGDKKNRPVISYKIEESSVKHTFKTTIQYIIGFNALLAQIGQSENIDFLELNTAKAIENIQQLAVKSGYRFSISTSVKNSNQLVLDKSTHFSRSESIWADAEFYFYGKVTNAGGKAKANIHLSTEEYGTLTINTPKDFLEKYESNLLYKTFGIWAKGKQHSGTGEIDPSSLSFLDLMDYEARYDEDYINSLRKKAKESWLGKVDPDKWLREIRGGYDA